MKRIKLTRDVGWWGKKDHVYDVNEIKAKELLKLRLKVDDNGIWKLTAQAEFVKDLGRHIGQSHHTYDKNGESEAFGPGKPPKHVTDHNEMLRDMAAKINTTIKIYECKLCGYRNNPDIYAMVKIEDRWWHNFCLEKTTWHTLKLIRSGQHDKVKMLDMFHKLNGKQKPPNNTDQ